MIVIYLLGKKKNPIPYMNIDDIQRFWDKVSFKNHWIWDFNCNVRTGYGMFKLKGKNFYAHRIAWFLVNHKQPPLSHDLDHLCKVKNCVNPDHLELVTHSTNCMRGNLGFKPKICQRGHKLQGYNRMVTAIRKNGTEKVRCRNCDNMRKRGYYHNPKCYEAKRRFTKSYIDYQYNYRHGFV